MKKYRISIVDDSRLTLSSLVDLITLSQEFSIIFTAKDGKDYLAKMDDCDPSILPQVVLMDIEMPIINGVEAMQRSRMKFPFVKYIVLTSHDDEEKIFKAIQAGAHGYLLKDEKVSVIKNHIKELINNHATPMSPSVAKKTFEMLSKSTFTGNQHISQSDNIFSELTNREMEVLHLMKEGHNYKVIAEKLYISTNTVRSHIAHIYEKLHVKSKYQMMNLMNKS
jgi:DNA-binding NarL/FixJ family response regulator